MSQNRKYSSRFIKLLAFDKITEVNTRRPRRCFDKVNEPSPIHDSV